MSTSFKTIPTQKQLTSLCPHTDPIERIGWVRDRTLDAIIMDLYRAQEAIADKSELVMHYTLAEFKVWCDNDEIKTSYLKYINNDFDEALKPYVIRKINNKGYVLDNLKVSVKVVFKKDTWKRERKHNAKYIERYDPRTDETKVFDTLKDAALAVGGTGGTISNSIRRRKEGKNATAYGYIFKYLK